MNRYLNFFYKCALTVIYTLNVHISPEMSLPSDTHAYNFITALPGGVLREFRGQTDGAAALEQGHGDGESVLHH